jgi:triacylglycerol lipase
MSSPRIAVCFHGFLRTGGSMWLVARALRGAGYSKIVLPTFGYHLAPLEVHADRAAALIEALAAEHPDASVDIVTHSYGGILARATLARLSRPIVRRVVMLAPPNHGAILAEQIRAVLPLHRLGWDPIAQLLPGAPARGTSQTTAAGAQIGVLTGGNGGTGYSSWLGGDNDGKVRVDEAQLDEALDFFVIPLRHSLMPFASASHRQILAFLEHGRFDREQRPLDTSDTPATVVTPTVVKPTRRGAG